MHEVIYREALGDGHKDSVATRYFNSNIVANRMAQKTDKEVNDLYMNIKFEHGDLHGIRYLARKNTNYLPEFYANGRMKEVLYNDVNSFLIYQEKKVSWDSAGEGPSFYDTGVPMYISSLAQRMVFKSGGFTYTGGYSGVGTLWGLSLAADGTITGSDKCLVESH